MISTLQGTIADIQEKYFIIEIAGIGLAVFFNEHQYKIGDEIKIYTHFQVREDNLSLYGFATNQERDFFKNLLTVSGVGPKMGMEILQTPLDQIKKGIMENNIPLLTTIKGLGKKTAQKIILELESKIQDIEINTKSKNKITEELIFALENLGFKRKQIFDKLKDLPEEIINNEEIVRWFLKKS